MRVRRKTLLATAAVACLSLAALGLTGGTAQAQVIDQSCVSAISITLSPGLNNQDQSDISLSGSGTLAACLSQGQASGLTATFTLSGTVSGTCLEAQTNATQQITWNDGSDSTVDLSGEVDEGTGDIGGPVESGLFAGDTVDFPNVLLESILADPLACESPGGLTSGSGDGDEVFTSVL
jgi:hypothetical protein